MHEHFSCSPKCCAGEILPNIPAAIIIHKSYLGLCKATKHEKFNRQKKYFPKKQPKSCQNRMQKWQNALKTQ